MQRAGKQGRGPALLSKQIEFGTILGASAEECLQNWILAGNLTKLRKASPGFGLHEEHQLVRLRFQIKVKMPSVLTVWNDNLKGDGSKFAELIVEWLPRFMALMH